MEIYKEEQGTQKRWVLRLVYACGTPCLVAVDATTGRGIVDIARVTNSGIRREYGAVYQLIDAGYTAQGVAFDPDGRIETYCPVTGQNAKSEPAPPTT